jgi:hypothetical protein
VSNRDFLSEIGFAWLQEYWTGPAGAALSAKSGAATQKGIASATPLGSRAIAGCYDYNLPDNQKMIRNQWVINLLNYLSESAT